MGEALLIEVALYQPYWHGAKEWPPSPLRLFQALLAGVGLGCGEALETEELAALEWLAAQAPPTVHAPRSRSGRAVRMFLPNNDLDAVGGELDRIASVRDEKWVRPRSLEEPAEFRFLWREPGALNPETLAALERAVAKLYQFGRGIDPAFARTRLCPAQELEAAARPSAELEFAPSAEGPAQLRCPEPATLESLRARHANLAARSKTGYLRQAEPARFRTVRYGETGAALLLFELRSAGTALGAGLFAWSLRAAHDLVTLVRDALAARLAAALPRCSAEIERVVVGRGAQARDKDRRIQIIPLPSVGTEHTDPAIRRIAVRVGGECPIAASDLAWALSGLHLGADAGTGELLDETRPVLVQAEERRMLRRYLGPERTWQTVTPVALRAHRSGREGSARVAAESAAGAEVQNALRHAGVDGPVASIRVQKEPWLSRGKMAAAFARTPRFEGSRLWHCEVVFQEPRNGPLVLGDGRYLGLGVMMPVAQPANDALVLTLSAESRPPADSAGVAVEALRRALMSRARDDAGGVDPLFSGHEDSPGPAASGRHRHAYLAALARNGRIDRLLVIAGWRVDRRWTPTDRERAHFPRVVEGLSEIKAGRAGVLRVEHCASADDSEEEFRESRRWRTATPYAPTRHARRETDWTRFAAQDLARECERRGLPVPQILIRSVAIGPRGGAEVQAEIEFPAPQSGPLLLGRTAHAGGGRFVPVTAAP